MMICVAFMIMTNVTTAFAQKYRVAACDWMMLKRQKLGEFQLAKTIGADGIEMDMGPLGKRPQFDNKLRDRHFQQLFRHTADSLGIEVPSVAMSGFFAQSLITRDNWRDLVADCLKTTDVMGAKVAFLPLGGSGREWQTMTGEPYNTLVARLHEAGEMARREGKIIALRTGMDARHTKRMLADVDSKGVKAYFNLQDAVDQGLDPSTELRILGRRRIAQIHASLTDSVTLDRDTRIDMPAVKRTLDRMGWSGWLVVERSRDVSRVRDVKYNFSTNVAYLKRLFQEKRDNK